MPPASRGGGAQLDRVGARRLVGRPAGGERQEQAEEQAVDVVVRNRGEHRRLGEHAAPERVQVLELAVELRQGLVDALGRAAGTRGVQRHAALVRRRKLEKLRLAARGAFDIVVAQDRRRVAGELRDRGGLQARWYQRFAPTVPEREQRGEKVDRSLAGEHRGAVRARFERGAKRRDANAELSPRERLAAAPADQAARVARAREDLRDRGERGARHGIRAWGKRCLRSSHSTPNSVPMAR